MRILIVKLHNCNILHLLIYNYAVQLYSFYCVIPLNVFNYINTYQSDLMPTDTNKTIVIIY